MWGHSLAYVTDSSGFCRLLYSSALPLIENSNNFTQWWKVIPQSKIAGNYENNLLCLALHASARHWISPVNYMLLHPFGSGVKDHSGSEVKVRGIWILPPLSFQTCEVVFYLIKSTHSQGSREPSCSPLFYSLVQGQVHDRLLDNP